MANTVTQGKVTIVGDKERKRIKDFYEDVKDKRKPNRLNDWEVNFVSGLFQGSLASTYTEVSWTPKQVDTLNKLEEKYYAAG